MRTLHVNPKCIGRIKRDHLHATNKVHKLEQKMYAEETKSKISLNIKFSPVQYF